MSLHMPLDISEKTEYLCTCDNPWSDYAGSRPSQKQSSQGLALARVEAGPDRVHTGDSSAAVGSRAVVWQRLCLRVVELPSWLHQLHCGHEHGTLVAAVHSPQPMRHCICSWCMCRISSYGIYGSCHHTVCVAYSINSELMSNLCCALSSLARENPRDSVTSAVSDISLLFTAIHPLYLCNLLSRLSNGSTSDLAQRLVVQQLLPQQSGSLSNSVVLVILLHDRSLSDIRCLVIRKSTHQVSNKKNVAQLSVSSCLSNGEYRLCLPASCGRLSTCTRQISKCLSRRAETSKPTAQNSYSDGGRWGTCWAWVTATWTISC